MTMEYFVHGPSSHELRFRKFARGHLITARLAIDRDHWLAINNRRRREPVEFPDREFHFRITNDRRRHQRIRSALRLVVQCLQWMISDLYRAKRILHRLYHLLSLVAVIVTVFSDSGNLR